MQELEGDGDGDRLVPSATRWTDQPREFPQPQPARFRHGVGHGAHGRFRP